MKPDRSYSLLIGLALFLIAGCSDNDRVERLLKRGDAAQQKEQYQAAISDYSRAIRINPNSAPARFKRGSIFVLTDEFEKAIEDLHVAVRLDPQNPVVWEMRG